MFEYRALAFSLSSRLNRSMIFVLIKSIDALIIAQC